MNDPTLRLQEEGVFDAEDQAACVAGIRAYLSKLPAAPLVLIKEPRITALSGLWLEAARQAGFDVAAVVTVRHPQEVIASLAARDGASPELANALWLKYNLLAERDSRGVPRVFVDSPTCSTTGAGKCAHFCGARRRANTGDEGAIEEFLNRLRRQRHRGTVTDLFGTDWISSAYNALSSAARDEPLDESTLDRIYQAYRASEHDFRTVFEDFREHFDFKSELQRSVFRPSITKKLRAFSLVTSRLGMDPYRRRYGGPHQ